MDKKIKIFLGAYINRINAQNITCRELAKYLNSERFEVYSLYHHAGTMSDLKIDNLKAFRCYRPVKFFGLIGYLWGLYKSDVAFLPRADFYKIQLYLLRFFSVKTFKSIENIIDEDAMDTALSVFNNDLSLIKRYYSLADSHHPITGFVGEYNLKRVQIKYNKPVLYLPTDFEEFSWISPDYSSLTEIVFIGNDFKRKRLREFVELAKVFPNLTFHIVGKPNFPADLELTTNITYHGSLDHEQMKKLFQNIQLHFLPSRSEGFGKVTIETAAAGIPSIVYSDYGAKEWIENWKEGIIVDDFMEVVNAIRRLLAEPYLLSELGSGARSMAQRFDSKILVKDYESVIYKLMDKKHD